MPLKPPTRPLDRGDVRPVPRRTRTFRPNYLSFAGTYQCNLTCAHCCVPIEWPDRLEIPPAIRFLEDAVGYGIRTLGFTGGEPFLYPEFLMALAARAVQLGCQFDKIMTNGVWYDSPAHLRRTLKQLADIGFTGKLGLSVDKFHGSRHTEQLAEFCRMARRVFHRDTIVSFSYASRAPDAGLEPIRELAADLGGVIEWSSVLRRFLLISPDLTITLNWNHLASVERAERILGRGTAPGFKRTIAKGRGKR
jgi:pyruvate-formate lyase-activating enzyme